MNPNEENTDTQAQGPTTQPVAGGNQQPATEVQPSVKDEQPVEAPAQSTPEVPVDPAPPASPQADVPAATEEQNPEGTQAGEPVDALADQVMPEQVPTEANVADETPAPTQTEDTPEQTPDSGEVKAATDTTETEVSAAEVETETVPEGSEQTDEKAPEAAAAPAAAPITTSKPKKNTPVVAIVAAVIVALVLAGITVFAYMAATNGNEDTSKTETKQQDQHVNPAVAIDEAVNEIDKSLNELNDVSDFSEDELTDQHLGL